MHKVYCIIGRSSTGKSTISKMAADRLGMSVLKSYTTREMRLGETAESADHVFITPENVSQYENDMVAYTDRVGYCSFATKQQLMKSDFYVIDPTGFYELLTNTKDMDIELVCIYITVPYEATKTRAKKRGDYEAWRVNYDAENGVFKDFEKSDNIRYRILNNGSIEESVNKVIHIIEKDRKAKHE